MSRNGVTYTYGDNNHKHAITSVVSKSYAYNSNGNMISRNSLVIEWDNDNRPKTATENGTQISNYVYDGDDKRVLKTEDGQTTSTLTNSMKRI